MNKLNVTALFLVVAVAASDVQACGEVMYRMGGALRYHAFITRHPAQILLYNGSSAQQTSGAEQDHFHQSLEKAGHTVTVVDNPEGLQRALAARSYDVIITYAADLPAIVAEIAHVAHEPSLIPVFQRGSEDRQARQQYPLALTEDANLNQFLKTIEQTMKARGA